MQERDECHTARNLIGQINHTGHASVVRSASMKILRALLYRFIYIKQKPSQATNLKRANSV